MTQNNDDHERRMAELRQSLWELTLKTNDAVSQSRRLIEQSRRIARVISDAAIAKIHG